MQQTGIRGVITALVTPFTKEGEVDEGGWIRNLQTQIQAGVHGVVVLGTTGEAPTISAPERRRLIQLARKTLPPSCCLWVGTGCASTQGTIALCQEAEELGADGLLVVVPYYNRPNQRGLLAHFQKVAASTRLPLYLYNVPKRTGTCLEVETILELSHTPSIAGLKDASGGLSDIQALVEKVRSHRPRFTLLCGDDPLTFPFLALGGDGIVSVISNLLPKEMVRLVASCLQGEWDMGRELHYQLLPIFRVLGVDTNPIPIKAAMEMCHIPAGPCRLPLTPLAPQHIQALQQQLSQYTHAFS